MGFWPENCGKLIFVVGGFLWVYSWANIVKKGCCEWVNWLGSYIILYLSRMEKISIDYPLVN